MLEELKSLREEVAKLKEEKEMYGFLWKEIYRVTTDAQNRGLTCKTALHLIQNLLLEYFKGVD